MSGRLSHWRTETGFSITSKKTDPRAAVDVDDRIRTQVRQLLQFPETGRLGRIEGTRELVISRTPYIAAYRITGDSVRILRLLHGAQQWPDEMLD
ncbi:type II toxin-antitoxin system RelE/ParE family toxin [Paraburkholderia ribeironis]|uniref:type II toxin-antitoxin system RelE/ParE family toxin n=1 Tax=Paraburkholderia ribeironis TaxID=1247936 RepID=UPI003183B0D4